MPPKKKQKAASPTLASHSGSSGAHLVVPFDASSLAYPPRLDATTHIAVVGTGPTYKHWLMKAEPDSRLEKGKDVKFSIDDLQTIGTSLWDGVRNHEAKVMMRDKMKVGHKALFYHSNTKVPGVYGLAEVVKEGYPDPSAFDSTHPYYDEKSDRSKPTWFCVDVAFRAKLAHPVTLGLLKHIASIPSKDMKKALHASGLEALTPRAVEAIRNMGLLKRGRLSVQPVTAEAYEAIVLLGDQGGWAQGGSTKNPEWTRADAAGAEGQEGGEEQEDKLNGSSQGEDGSKGKKRKAAEELVEGGGGGGASQGSSMENGRVGTRKSPRAKKE